MKFTTLIALVCVATSTSAIQVMGDGEAAAAKAPAAAAKAPAAAAKAPAAAAKGPVPAELAKAAPAAPAGPDPEDAWLTIPKFTDAVQDKDWGKDVQRLGHADWLDGHVKEIKVIRSFVPPMPEKEDRVAVADS